MAEIEANNDEIIVDLEVNLPQNEIELALDSLEELNNEDRNVLEVDSSAKSEKDVSENIKYGNSEGPKEPHRGPREMYEGKDQLAKKLKLTKVQYDFVQSYLRTGNAALASREARGTEIRESDRVVGYGMKNNTRINQYIQETAEVCANIQFDEIIKNPKAPYSVRNDAIKDRLDRAGVGAKFETPDTGGNMFVGNMTISIEQ